MSSLQGTYVIYEISSDCLVTLSFLNGGAFICGESDLGAYSNSGAICGRSRRALRGFVPDMASSDVNWEDLISCYSVQSLRKGVSRNFVFREVIAYYE